MLGHGAQRGGQRVVHGVAVVAGGAIAVAVIAGCASKDSGLATRSDKSAGGAIQFAAAQIVAAKSVHVHGAVTGTTSGTVDGSLVFAPKLEGDLTLKADQYADTMPTRFLYDGTTFYSSIPKADHATSKAKPNASWFSIDVASVMPKDSPVLALLKSDPAALVKELLAKGKFTEAGTGTADGVAATHFTGDLTGEASGHVDVWLNASGLPVEIVVQTPTDKQPPARTELHFSQWGDKVAITTPPADQVLTDKDEISFAISGQQFKIPGDQPDGSTFTQGGPVQIGPSSTSAEPICVPFTLPSYTPEPGKPAPTSLCFKPSISESVPPPAQPTNS